MKKLVLAFFAALLLLAFGFRVYSSLQPRPEPTLSIPLAEVIPAEIPGWKVADIPLGPTESVAERSEEVLQFDDYVQRAYQQGPITFTVYVAYWEPGAMPIRQVNTHTPDVCWIANGFTCTERDFARVKPWSGGQLQPAQAGTYENRLEQSTYAYFWHVVDGQAHWHKGDGGSRTPLAFFVDSFQRYGFDTFREQFFIRITSDRPLDQIWNTSAMQAVVDRLADLCLAEATTLDTAAAPQL